MKLWTRRPDLRNEVERLRNHLAEVEAAHADELANLGAQLELVRAEGRVLLGALAEEASRNTKALQTLVEGLAEIIQGYANRSSELAHQFGPLIDVAPLLLASADVQGLAHQLHGLSDGAREAGVPYPDPVDERLVTAGLANPGNSHRGPTLTHAGAVALGAYDRLHQAS